MSRWLVALVLVAACGDPPPMVLKFRITDGDVQGCTSSTGTKATSCEDVTMLCDAYASIRIFAPSDPTAPFVSACQQLVAGPKAKNVCSIAQVPLPAPEMPISAQTLEVDMAIYPKASLHTDSMGNIVCPSQPMFGADGFPVLAQDPCTDPDPTTCDPQPAIGGRAFYHPGDTQTVVSLGCTNLEALEDRSCAGQSSLSVSATVNDFDTSVSVSPATADGLLVSIGEPTFSASVMGYQLQSSQTHELDRAPESPVPSWQGDLDLQLMSSACLEVFEDNAQSTAALTCTNDIARNPLDLPGIRLSTTTLNKILAALSLTTFPDQGLVVGIVLDSSGIAKPGVTIVPSDPSATVKYLSVDLSTVVPGATSKSGVWVSQDAKYGTSFGTSDISALTQPGFGGLVHQKVDIVVIQFKPPGTGG
jgi:hypothetical protein